LCRDNSLKTGARGRCLQVHRALSAMMMIVSGGGPGLVYDTELSACGWAAGWGTDKTENWLWALLIACIWEKQHLKS
jgi:hypothetical protein